MHTLVRDNVCDVNIKLDSLMNTYHHGDLRAALLAQARQALEADGGGGFSLRGLAAAVGVSPNAPYRHFPNKESVLAAVSTQGFAELTARFEPYRSADGPDRLAGCLTAYLSFARGNPGLYRLMFGRDLDPLSCDEALGAQAQACFTALMSIVAHLLNTDMVDSRVPKAATLVWSLCHGAALLDIDRTAAFLVESQRLDAVDLAITLTAGLGAQILIPTSQVR